MITIVRCMPTKRESQAVVKASRWLFWPVGSKGQSSGIASECVAHATSFIYYKKSVQLRGQPSFTALRRPAAGATPLRFAKVGLVLVSLHIIQELTHMERFERVAELGKRVK